MVSDPYLGNYTTCVSARSTDKEILQKAQDGGIATALMVYALEQGIIDGTIVAGEGDRPWQPRPFVAMSREGILKAQGTKYNISPQISWLKEATRSFGLDKVGVTGVCCQMQAVRKAQLYPINMRDVPGKIAFTVGLFCMENFPYKSLQTLVEDHAGQNLSSVKKMEIGKGKFWVYTERGNVVSLPHQGDPQVRAARLPRLPRLCLQPRRHLDRLGRKPRWLVHGLHPHQGGERRLVQGGRRGFVRDEAHRGGQARPRARHEAREGEDRQEPKDGRGAQDLRRQQGAAGPLHLKLIFFSSSKLFALSTANMGME